MPKAKKAQAKSNFDAWYSTISGVLGLSKKPNIKNYNYRGFYDKYARGNETKQLMETLLTPDWHFPDEFKMPSHPTFSTDSQYSKGKLQGGTWDYSTQPETFRPSLTNFLMQLLQRQDFR